MSESTAGDPAEDAVRRYLTYLADPSALVDRQLIDALKKRLADEPDVVGRLKIVAAIESLETVDESSLRKDFVAHARRYAQREDIPASAFAAMGVSKEVLVEAGLVEHGKASGRSGRARTRVGREQILAAIPDGYFTIRELETTTGANAITVRKTMDDLVAAGQLGEHEPDPEYQGRGRAPRRYKKI